VIEPPFDGTVSVCNAIQTLRRSDQIKPAILVMSAASAVIKVASIMGISFLLGESDNPFGSV
jgi:hypothetical protein